MGGRLGGCPGRPATEKENASGGAGGLRYGAAAMQGWRPTMEDSHLALTPIGDEPPLDEWALFGVFDGHAGACVSAQCALRLPDELLNEGDFWMRPGDALRTAFLRLDERLRELPPETRRGGSTAIVALVNLREGGPAVLANCGDSRALLCRDGTPALSTRDHKPALPEESARIRRAGGAVLVSRLNGSLAVSRALGDFDYKAERALGVCEQLVSPEPELFAWERQPDDEFLLLACDGVWDVLSNEEATAYVRRMLYITDDLCEIANRLIDACLAKGSDDNMSVVIVTFPGAPKPTKEARDADRRLDEKIRERIAEMIHGGEQFKKSIYKQVQMIPDFLPGGGIHDKWTLIQDTMEELGLKSDDESMSDAN